MFDRPRRTRYCEVWDEKVSTVGEARLALQLINVYDSPDPLEIRACYYANGRLQVRPPHFAARHWLPLIAAVLLDPDWVDNLEVATVLEAACERLGIPLPAPAAAGKTTP